MNTTKIYLSPALFSERETVLVENSTLKASTFRYPSGVCGLRISNERGNLIVLPFQGQQIWSARFNERDLGMKSMFDYPRPTRNYLETYGAFLIHCGFTAMGVPGPGDTHPLHGELPNAPYEEAWLISSSDENGPSLEVGGRYQHTVAFSTNYAAEPFVRLYAGKSTFMAGIEVTNLKKTPMEYMYLAHINFRPVDDACLEYSAPYDKAHVRVRTSIPSHIHPLPGYKDFLEQLAADPSLHHTLRPELAFDPEVVFYVDYTKDSEGWAHTLQVHPDGNADYVRHRPEKAPKGVRWICRTPDQDALGMILPATAEPEGYTAEKAKGNLKVLAPGKSYLCLFELGALEPQEAENIREKIRRMQA